MFWYFGWLFIAVLALSILGIFYATKDWYSNRDGILNVSMGLLFIDVILWIPMIVWDLSNKSHKMDFYDERYNVCDTTIIKSAATNSELHGQFFLGCGTVDNEDVYKFYEVVDSNSYKMISRPAEHTRIQEVEADSTFVPHVVDYYYTEGTMKHCKFYQLMLNRPETENFHNIHQLKEHVIYVPKGTIVGDLSKLNL